MKAMKVSVTITVNMPHPEQWYETYGTGSTAAEIRQLVKEHIGNGFSCAPFNGEVDAEITWR